MVRSGNEDAFALFHASVAHENQLEDLPRELENLKKTLPKVHITQ